MCPPHPEGSVKLGHPARTRGRKDLLQPGGPSPFKLCLSGRGSKATSPLLVIACRGPGDTWKWSFQWLVNSAAFMGTDYFFGTLPFPSYLVSASIIRDMTVMVLSDTQSLLKQNPLPMIFHTVPFPFLVTSWHRGSWTLP